MKWAEKGVTLSRLFQIVRTIMENVIPLPAKLERLSKRIKKNMAIGHEIRVQWIESKIEMACDLLDARREFGKDNNQFHNWLTAEGLGDVTLPKDDRAALIAMGADPDRMRAVFAATNSWSPRLIYAREWESSQRCDNTAKSSRRGKPTAKREAARAAVREKVEAGAPVSRPAVAAEIGIGNHAVQLAIEYERGRVDGLREAEALGAVYTKAQTHHIERAIKAYQRELDAKLKQHIEKLEADFEARVQKRFEEAKAAAWPIFEKETEEARLDKEYYRKLIDGHKLPLTIDEYRDIQFCCRNKEPGEDRRHRATIALESKKLQLTGKQ